MEQNRTEPSSVLLVKLSETKQEFCNLTFGCGSIAERLEIKLERKREKRAQGKARD